MAGYSIHFNYERSCWIAKFKDNSGKWKQKWLPKLYGASQRLEAENYFTNWLISFRNGLDVSPAPVLKKSIKLIAPKWLELRKKDPGTKLNTWRGFQTSVRTWILDNEEFNHTSIENLDIEKELTVSVIREWIQSFNGIEYRTRIGIVRALKVMLNDAAAEGWISEDYSNVIEKKPIKKLVSDLTKAARDNHQIITLPTESWHALMGPSYRIKDVRKVRYLLVLLTGMRDHETEGLVWSDLHLEEPIAYVNVERQLDKIGSGMVRYEDLVKDGLSKEQIQKHPKAIVSNPKYNSKRIIPIHPLLLKVLVWWKEVGYRRFTGANWGEELPVFPHGIWAGNGNGHPLQFCLSDSACLLRKDLERVGKADKRITFHSLRRTFATMLGDSGVEEYKISHLLGHKAAGTAVQNYIAKNLQSFFEAVCRLPIPTKVVFANEEV